MSGRCLKEISCQFSVILEAQRKRSLGMSHQ